MAPLMFILSCILIVLKHSNGASTGGLEVVPALPALPGYLMCAQYWCDDFLCPDWELDITRLETVFRPIQWDLRLARLYPENPIAEMNFQVLTAWDESARTFYATGNTKFGQSLLWSAAVLPDVSNITLSKQVTTVSYANNSVMLTRIHAISGFSQGGVVAVFSDGSVSFINTVTGTLTSVCNVLADSRVAGGLVTQSSSINSATGTLYVMVQNAVVNVSAPFLVSVNLAKGVSTIVPIVLDQPNFHQYWEAERFFNGVWASDRQSMIVFAQGGGANGDDGFDQILEIFPSGKALCIYCNLLEAGSFYFNINAPLKWDDTLQTGSYDPVAHRLYYQATYCSADDDTSCTTSLLYTDISGKYPYTDVNISPFGFEYMGFFYIPKIQA